MPLDFHITDGRHDAVTAIDAPACGIDQPAHEELFLRLREAGGGYPCLESFSDYYSDGFVPLGSLRPLIAELEAAAVLFADDSPQRMFLGTLHSLCCIAFFRQYDISSFAD